MVAEHDGGEAVLEALRALEVEYVFSSPGSEWPAVWEAFTRRAHGAGDGPRYVNLWHESLAVAMAIGHARYSGRMQAVLLHAGAGPLQGAMAISSAFLRESPVLVCSGESASFGELDDFDPGGQWYRGLGVVGGSDRWMAPFVKWSGRVTSPATLFETLVRAGELALRAPRGPAYLTVPMEVLRAPWRPPSHRRRVPSPPVTVPEEKAVAAVVARIAAAARPLIVTETAGRDPAAFAHLIRLAEARAIPVVESPAAMYANFPKTHPLHRGYDAGPYLADADLVLVVANRAPWYPPGAAPPPDAVIVVDDHPIKEQMPYQRLEAGAYLEGDLAATLGLLADAASAAAGSPPECWAAPVAPARRPPPGTGEGIDPAHLCDLLAGLEGEPAFVDETIVHRPVLMRRAAWSMPGSYFRAAGGLGVGLGLALGIKLAAGERLVVTCIGDGSLLYNPVLPALGAAAEHALPTLIVVFDNRSYESMRRMHLKFYPEGVAAATDTWFGVDIPGPDYAAVARSLGAHGERVEDPGRLEDALGAAVAEVRSGRTALLDVALAW